METQHQGERDELISDYRTAPITRALMKWEYLHLQRRKIYALSFKFASVDGERADSITDKIN